jgi:phage-related protein
MLTVRFFESDSGSVPVTDWLRSLSREDRKIIGEGLLYLQTSWPVGMPKCRPMGNGLYELRSNISDGRISRVLFGFVGGEIAVLHAFVKKTQKTPAADLELARERLNLLKVRYGKK